MEPAILYQILEKCYSFGAFLDFIEKEECFARNQALLREGGQARQDILLVFRPL